MSKNKLAIIKARKKSCIDFHTKVETSISNYFYDVPIDRNAVKKRKWMGIWPEGDTEFAGRIIIKGNILSLINIEDTVNENTFWNQSIFYQLTTASFWTFNSLFKSKLITLIETFRFENSVALYKMLDKHFLPYRSDQTIERGSYVWAKNAKLPNLLADPEFARVFELDYDNRLGIKLALKKHIVEILRKERKPKEVIVTEMVGDIPISQHVTKSIGEKETEVKLPVKRSNIILDPLLFPSLFKSSGHFAAFMTITEKAGYGILLKRVPKNKKGTPTRFNHLSCLLVRLFDDAGYFKNNDLSVTTKAFLGYSRNHISDRFTHYFNLAANNKKGQPEDILNFTYLIKEGIKDYKTTG